jgi:hypothetical protein
LLRFAEDDAPYGDLTTDDLGFGDDAGEATLTAAAEELELKPGMAAIAVIKASDVMVGI